MHATQGHVSNGHALLFEALPPKLEATGGEWQDHLDLLDPLKKVGLAGVNVPEIVNGHYQTVEPRGFAVALHRLLGVRPIVNRITVHHKLPELISWTTQSSHGFGIKDLVLVGGEKSTEEYPGPGVNESLRALRPQVHRSGGTLGVITIPTRRRESNDEPQRLLAKQEAGASYAISQILCEPIAAQRLQKDLAAAAKAADKPAIPILWSLAPVSKTRDIEFLKWLGVEVPAAHGTAILGRTGNAARIEESHVRNEAIVRSILEHAETNNLVAPGFCIEHVMLSNIEAAIGLVERIRALCKEFRGVTPELPGLELATAW